MFPYGGLRNVKNVFLTLQKFFCSFLFRFRLALVFPANYYLANMNWQHELLSSTQSINRLGSIEAKMYFLTSDLYLFLQPPASLGCRVWRFSFFFVDFLFLICFLKFFFWFITKLVIPILVLSKKI